MEENAIPNDEVVYTSKVKMTLKGNIIYVSIMDMNDVEIVKVGRFRADEIKDHMIQGIEFAKVENNAKKSVIEIAKDRVTSKEMHVQKVSDMKEGIKKNSERNKLAFEERKKQSEDAKKQVKELIASRAKLSTKKEDKKKAR
jgi:hypothetical protein